jgi:hypothetical protein
MKITSISPTNQALQFIEKRIKSDDYRGGNLSQQNRYTYKQVKSILTIFNKLCPITDKMTIRIGDISNKPYNTADEIIYSHFCDEVKKECGIGTQDAMRKNLFVDLHRMELIIRYDKHGIPTNPYKRTPIKYVSLTDLGHKFINSNFHDGYFIFAQAIDNLLRHAVEFLLHILRDESYQINYIGFDEYMFFVSAIECGFDFEISCAESINLINDFRLLSKGQQEAVVDTLKTTMNPKEQRGNKTQKRDFGNWKNQIQQIFSLLDQTPYFHYNKKTGKLALRIDNDNQEFTKKLCRSNTEKELYFKKHNIEKKQLGFELHHIIPLSWSDNIHQFKLLDSWENMIYIDAYSHAKISQQRNRHVKLAFVAENVVLSKLDNDSNNVIELIRQKNIEYNVSYQTSMKQYNIDLLDK